MAKNNNDSFKSIQIISSKAQSLWSKAKERIQRGSEPMGKTKDIPLIAEERKQVMHIEVASWTVARATMTALAVIAAAFVLFIVRDKLILMLLAVFLAMVIDGSVKTMERWGFPRSLSVVLLFLMFLSIAIFLIVSLVPIVANQIQDLARFINQSADAFFANPEIHISFLSSGLNDKLTALVQEILRNLQIQDRASAMLQFGENLSGIATSTIAFTVSVAGSVVNFSVSLVLILFLSFFIQMEREKIADGVRIFVPRAYRNYYDAKAELISLKISQWFQGQLMLCISIGLLVFIALQILGMPYATTLALLAGFTEFIPYAGPVIAAVPAILIALTQFGFGWAAVILAVYYIIQTCENNLLVPLIMKHAVGLSPIAVIFGMLIGVSFPNTIHPIVGIILAVPITTIFTIFIKDFQEVRKKK